MCRFVWTSRGQAQTEALGALLAVELRAGDAVALAGDLGTGKTAFVRGIARGLGIDERKVKSPTFVLVHVYASKIPLVHMDAYRLGGTLEASALGEEELFAPDRITCVEWAQRCPDLFPEAHLSVALEYISSDERQLSFTARGKRYAALVARLPDRVRQVEGQCS